MVRMFVLMGSLVVVTMALSATSFAVASSGAAPLAVSQAQTSPPAPSAGSGRMMGGQMMDMQAADKKLDDLVAVMNAAKGDDARLTAITAVVNELVAQHKAMHGQMMMGRGMMGGMGGMMPSGGSTAGDSKK
jgi:uncharacterized protein (DUF2342 family)